MSEVTWTPKDGPSREDAQRNLNLAKIPPGVCRTGSPPDLRWYYATLAAHDLYAENQRLERELAEYRRVLFPAP